jgi:hypothetical protein
MILWKLNLNPQGLEPIVFLALSGTTKVVP